MTWRETWDFIKGALKFLIILLLVIGTILVPVYFIVHVPIDYFFLESVITINLGLFMLGWAMIMVFGFYLETFKFAFTRIAPAFVTAIVALSSICGFWYLLKFIFSLV